MNVGSETFGIEISGWGLRTIITDSSGTAHGASRSFDSLVRPAAPRIRNMADFPKTVGLRTPRNRRLIAHCVGRGLQLLACRSDKALRDGEGCSGSPAAGVEFGHDVLDVRLGGARADV